MQEWEKKRAEQQRVKAVIGDDSHAEAVTKFMNSVSACIYVLYMTCNCYVNMYMYLMFSWNTGARASDEANEAYDALHDLRRGHF